MLTEESRKWVTLFPGQVFKFSVCLKIFIIKCCVCVSSGMTLMIRWIWDHCRRREGVLRGLLEEALSWESPLCPPTMSPPPLYPPAKSAQPHSSSQTHSPRPLPGLSRKSVCLLGPPVLHVKLDSLAPLRLVPARH